MAAVATQPPKQAQHERSMVGKKQNTQCNQSFSTPIKRSNVTPLFVNFKGKILWFRACSPAYSLPKSHMNIYIQSFGRLYANIFFKTEDFSFRLRRGASLVWLPLFYLFLLKPCLNTVELFVNELQDKHGVKNVKIPL